MAKSKNKTNSKKEYDYIVYTDGGCAFNPGGPGGCAAVVTEAKTGKKTELSRAYTSTTNNRMEMMAVILALESLPEKQLCVCILIRSMSSKRYRANTGKRKMWIYGSA